MAVPLSPTARAAAGRPVRAVVIQGPCGRCATVTPELRARTQSHPLQALLEPCGGIGMRLASARGVGNPIAQPDNSRHGIGRGCLHLARSESHAYELDRPGTVAGRARDPTRT